MNLDIVTRFAVIIVSITSLLAGCSAQPLKRSPCENQAKHENRASSVRSYNPQYDDYQRTREDYLRERQEAICR